MSDFDDIPEVENRVRALEDDDNAIWAELRDLKRRLAAAEQRSLTPRTPPGGGSGGLLAAKTPAGGIPASSGTTWPYTPGSAACEMGTFDGATFTDAGYTDTVFNTCAAVAGNKLVLIGQLAGYNFAIVEPC